MGLDPVAAAIAMMSHGDHILPSPALKVGEVDSLQNEPLLSDAFDGCTRELSEKASGETGVSDISDAKLLPVVTLEAQSEENKLVCDSLFTKCGSSGSLGSIEWVNGAPAGPHLLDFPELDFGGAHGMRRAFSEGDIKVRYKNVTNSYLLLFLSTLKSSSLLSQARTTSHIHSPDH